MNINEIKFRSAGLPDADSIAALVNSVYRGENAKKGWTSEAGLLDGVRINAERAKEIINTDGHVILVLNEGEKLIGCVHLQKMNEKCMLGMLSVDVNYQDKGIGKIIINKSEEYARSEFGSSEMIMKVIDVRTELIAYYKRRGYTSTGKKESFGKNHFGNMKVVELAFEYLSKQL